MTFGNLNGAAESSSKPSVKVQRTPTLKINIFYGDVVLAIDFLAVVL